MKKTEKIVGLIALIGLTLKVLLINGGGVITVLSLSFLSLLYFIFGFALFNDIPLRNVFKKQTYDPISKGRLVGSILLGFALSALVIGILFSVQLYNGSQFQLINGLVWTTAILIVSIVRLASTKSIFYKQVITRIAILGVIGLILCITPTWKIVEILKRKHPAYVEAVKNLSADPENKALQEEVQKQREIMWAEAEKNDKQ